MSYIVIGATAGVGRAIATELARRGQHLILVASSAEDLQAAVADLSLRFNVQATPLVLDLGRELNADEFRRQCLNISEHVDGIIYTAGHVSDADSGYLDETEIAQIVNVNFKALLSICNSFFSYFKEKNRGTVVAFSSIAAARGRKNNILYGAMKRALEAYFEGLRHLFSSGKVRFQVYGLGYVETQMTFGRKLLFPIAKPEAVAREVCDNLEKDFGFKYYPGFWRVIIFVIRNLPWFLFKKLDF